MGLYLESWCQRRCVGPAKIPNVSTSTTIGDIASVATALAALFVGWQVRLAKQQLRASFEQTFTDRYKEIFSQIPLELLLDDGRSDSDEIERAFYDYFELCEEEMYYRCVGKVAKSTWVDWWIGIRMNLQRAAFRRAWDELRARTTILSGQTTGTSSLQFDRLREAVVLADEGKDYDPRESREPWRILSRRFRVTSAPAR
jgi:hypothetical protein